MTDPAGETEWSSDELKLCPYCGLFLHHKALDRQTLSMLATRDSSPLLGHPTILLLSCSSGCIGQESLCSSRLPGKSEPFFKVLLEPSHP